MASEFTYFPQLPTELRLQVWRCCLPHRVAELDTPEPSYVRTTCELARTTYLNSRPPIITRVCRESRTVAFETGYYLDDGAWEEEDGDVENDDLEDYWTGQNLTSLFKGTWFDSKRDILHLNWEPGYDVHTNGHGNAITWMQRLARVNKLADVSINANLIVGFDTDLRHVHPIKEHLDFLERRKEYLVNLKMVCIHASIQKARQMGLFLDEYITLVHPLDTESIRKYHQLYLQGPGLDTEPRTFFESALGEGFQQRIQDWLDDAETVWVAHKWYNERVDDDRIPQDIWTGEENGFPAEEIDFDKLGPDNQWTFDVREHPLRKHHPWVQETIGEMPRLRPMIMFRLCTRKCYDGLIN